MADGGLVRRAYGADDAVAVAALMNLVAEHAGGRPGFTPVELHGLVSTLVHDVETDSTLLHAADGTLVAAGFTTTPPAGGYRVHVTGGVHPSWRGRGIGRELLLRHLDRAVELHRERAPLAEWEANVRVPVGDTDALRLYARLGLTPVRYWFEMAAPVGAALRPPAEAASVVTASDAGTAGGIPGTAAAGVASEVAASVGAAGASPGRAVDGVRLVAYSPDHTAAVHAAHMEAFVDNWGYQHRELASWARITVGAAGFLPGLSLVALDGVELAGYLLTYAHTEAGRVYVGQLGVRKPWRRRGLAGELLAGVLAAAAADDRAVVGLSVDADSPTGAVGVYARAGFAVEFSAVTHSMRIGG